MKKRLHVCPHCGCVVMALPRSFKPVSIKYAIQWLIGWDHKHWWLAWTCPRCGEFNKTHDIWYNR